MMAQEVMGLLKLGLLMLGIAGIQCAEFCNHEMFSPRCSQNEVIMLTSAFYGRMRVGRCVPGDLGHIGCQGNVLHVADRSCSGQRQCDVKVPVREFEELSACHQGLAMYLAVDFSCMPVLSPQGCEHTTRVDVGAFPRYLLGGAPRSSLSCPTAPHTWELRALPGQTVNLTLVDFGWRPRSLQANGMFSCNEYATIQEPATSEGVAVCGGLDRQRFVYQSLGHVVHVRTSATLRDPTRFLIKFQVVGCPSLSTPVNGWLDRNGNDVSAGCDHEDTKWKLHCDGKRWNGRLGNCSAVTGVEQIPMKDQIIIVFGWHIPFGVALAVLIGIVIIVFFLIACIGMLCYVRCKRRTPLDTNTHVRYNNVATELEDNESDPYWTFNKNTGYSKNATMYNPHCPPPGYLDNAQHMPYPQQQSVPPRPVPPPPRQTPPHDYERYQNTRQRNPPPTGPPPPIPGNHQQDSHTYQSLKDLNTNPAYRTPSAMQASRDTIDEEKDYEDNDYNASVLSGATGVSRKYYVLDPNEICPNDEGGKEEASG